MHAHLRGKLHKEVVICSEGTDADTLADGGGQSFDLIETAVQLVQICQPDEEEGGLRACGAITIYTVHTMWNKFNLLWKEHSSDLWMHFHKCGLQGTKSPESYTFHNAAQ